MKNKIKTAVIIIIILITIYIVSRVSLIEEILTVILTAYIIAYALKPFHTKMREKGISKRFSAVIIIFALVIGILLCFTILIPSIFRESYNIRNTVNLIEGYVQNFYMRLKPMKDNKTVYSILENINNKINTITVRTFSKVFDGLMNVAEDVLSLSVLPIITYYFLIDFEKMGNKFLLLFPEKIRKVAEKIMNDIDKIMSNYIYSQFILSIIISIVTFFILFSLKVNFPIILSILNGIFNIIPYFGPLLGALPAILVALLKSPSAAIWTTVLLLILQQVEGNIISPKLTGESISMHPLTIILILIIGGKIGGFFGMVLAVPVGIIIKIAFEDLNYYMF